MFFRVKYALDAQDNVGIFSAELNPGDMSVISREEKDGKVYQVALMNDSGTLFVRIQDPDRAERGESPKIRKLAQANEVFSVGSATIMIMNIAGESIGGSPETQKPKETMAKAAASPEVKLPPREPVAPAPQEVKPPQVEVKAPPVEVKPPPAPKKVEMPAPVKERKPAPKMVAPIPMAPEPHAVQIGPEEDSVIFQTDSGVTPTPSSSPPMREIKTAESPIQIELPKPELEPEMKEDTFARNMRENLTKANVEVLPSVEGISLNYDYKYEEQEKPPVKESNEKPAPVKPKPVPVRKEESTDVNRFRSEIQFTPKSREQLFTEDVRDRRFYLKGARYSLRNKISALVLSLGILGLGIYYLGVSHLAERGHESLVSEAISSQTYLKAQEFKSRFLQYNQVVNSIIKLVSDPKIDSQTLAKSYEGFDFIVSVGVIRFLSAAEVEPPKPVFDPSVPVNLNLAFVKRKPAAKPILTPVPPPAPKYDVAKLHKMEDGNYLEPVLQWVKESEAASLGLDYSKVSTLQMKKVTELLTKRANPYAFDPKELALPPEENGVFTYLVREQPLSTVFVVIQTSNKYFDQFFSTANDLEFYLINKKESILYPVSKRSAEGTMGSFKDYLNSPSRVPASTHGYLGSVPLTTNWDFVVRPNESKAAVMQTDLKLFFMLGVIILLVYLASGVWFAKNITEPLRTLVLQIESVAAGDYHRKHIVPSNDEIGQVADYFEYLSGTLKRKEQALAVVTDLASKDALTSLYNHRYFRSHLETKWKEIERNRTGALILIDIDNFKIFNMAHGHIQGDAVLKELAVAISESAKGSGMVARYGGEEIVLWAPTFDQKSGFALAEKILAKIRGLKVPNLTGGTPFTVTCSLGVAVFNPTRHTSIDRFLMDVDYNVSMAKKAGKNRIWAGTV